MKNKIKVTGNINSWGHNSIDSAEVFFDKHIKDCSCGGSYSYSAMLEMEQIKEGDFVDTCETIECNNCYSMLNVDDYDITLEIPNNLAEQFSKEKIWCKSKDYVEMSQGMNTMDWEAQMGNKSFKELAEQELKAQGVI
jgi:hypothetical protein